MTAIRQNFFFYKYFILSNPLHQTQISTLFDDGYFYSFALFKILSDSLIDDFPVSGLLARTEASTLSMVPSICAQVDLSIAFNCGAEVSQACSKSSALVLQLQNHLNLHRLAYRFQL